MKILNVSEVYTEIYVYKINRLIIKRNFTLSDMLLVVLFQKFISFIVTGSKMNIDDFFDLNVLLHQERDQRTVKPRIDPREELTERQFKKHFRFSKCMVSQIALMLGPSLIHQSNRGLPLSPVMKVCIALGMYGGGHFQRIAGLCGGVSQYAARQALKEVTEALLQYRKQYIFMPTINEMHETAEKMFQRFKLPRFALGVDGVMIKFETAPRKLPENKHPQQFWCRKQFYAINAQVVADDRLIRDIDIRWPGSTHDGRIWGRSQVKPYLEQQRRFLIAGDSGYPISEVLIKPYTTAEAANDPRKRLFNRRHSGLRTVMTENIYGMWKRKFPILKGLRTDFSFSQKIILACAILFNLGRIEAEMEETDDDSDEGGETEDSFDEDGDEDVIHVIDEERNAVRQKGQQEREKLLRAMRD